MFYELNISMFPDAVEVDTKDLYDDLKCYRHPKFMRLMPRYGLIDVPQYDSLVFVNTDGVITNFLDFESSPTYQEFVAAIPGIYK